MKTLTAFCDLALCPVSYDFVVWLMRAMVERDAKGCDGLHVVLVPHEQGLGGFARNWGEHDEAATRWRLWNVVVPAVQLAGATVTLAASRFQADRLRTGEDWWPEGRCHLAGPLVEDWRAGKFFHARLRASDAARRYVSRWFEGETRPVVTLTTRQNQTHPDRNSTDDAWDSLYGWLPDQHYAVVRLTDSHVALGNRGGTWPELSVDLRLALYERAAMNCIGTNGPAVLLWFSGAPFLQFGFGLPEKVWAEHMVKHLSMKPGDQLPWANPDQRIIWRPDTFAVMREEFQAWERECS